MTFFFFRILFCDSVAFRDSSRDARSKRVHQVVHRLRRQTEVVLVRRARVFQRQRNAFAQVPERERLLFVFAD